MSQQLCDAVAYMNNTLGSGSWTLFAIGELSYPKGRTDISVLFFINKSIIKQTTIAEMDGHRQGWPSVDNPNNRMTNPNQLLDNRYVLYRLHWIELKGIVLYFNHFPNRIFSSWRTDFRLTWLGKSGKIGQIRRNSPYKKRMLWRGTTTWKRGN